MTRYITKAERFILSRLPNERFDLQRSGFYRIRLTAGIIAALIDANGTTESLRLLDDIIERVGRRRETYKTKLHRWQLQCYRRWLIEIRNRIERLNDQP